GAGTVLHEIGRWDAAREAYESALRIAPRLRTALWNLALLHEERKQFLQAEELYARLVESEPEAQEAWFRLGYARLQLGEIASAMGACESCLALPRKWPEALLNMGIAHWKLRHLDQAKETFRQCLGSVSTAPSALRCLAAIALEQQDYEQARALHKQLLE